MLSEISQSRKDKYDDSTYLRYLKQENLETEIVESGGQVLWGREGRNGEPLSNGREVSAQEDELVPEIRVRTVLVVNDTVFLRFQSC